MNEEMMMNGEMMNELTETELDSIAGGANCPGCGRKVKQSGITAALHWLFHPSCLGFYPV